MHNKHRHRKKEPDFQDPAASSCHAMGPEASCSLFILFFQIPEYRLKRRIHLPEPAVLLFIPFRQVSIWLNGFYDSVSYTHLIPPRQWRQENKMAPVT